MKQLKAKLTWYPYQHQHNKQILTAITGIVILAVTTVAMIDQWKLPEIPSSALQSVSETVSAYTSESASLLAAEAAYKFQSSLIETAVREILGKSEMDPITYNDLGQITSLYICGKQIYYNQEISDLTPLKDLQYLSRLGVGLNNIDDLEPLLSLNRLSLLDISANPISNDDIANLSELPNLYGLDIGATYVTSIYGIKNLLLGSLSVFDCKVGDCVGLDEMTSLETFITTGVNNTITDIAIDRIAKLVNLKTFKIFGSDSFDLSKLATLKSISLLDLCGMKTDSLEGLNNPSVEQLYIDVWNSLDLTGVDRFTNATLISLRDSVCSDYNPLLKVPNLQAINCNREQSEIIKEQLGEVPFQINIQ